MKKILIVNLLLVGICFILVGCEEKITNYSKYTFTDMSWTRETEFDIEYIKFSSNGSFSYYCACGNPVNDSDLCEVYTYDDRTKIIKLECFDTTESMITNIKIINYDEKSIELDFNGEIRKFIKE